MPLLQVENLSLASRVKAPSGVRVLAASVTFAVAAGEHLAVVGERGPAQTALARTISLVERPAGGRVYFEGRDVTRAWGGRLRALRRGLQYVGGDARRSLSPRLAIEQVLAEPLQVHHLGTPAERRARVRAAAEAWQLNGLLLGLRANALSNALCQRVALARAYLLQPRVLVCDGIAERVEPAGVQPLLALVAHLCRAAGIAWVWTTADPALAHAFADRVLTLADGRVRDTANE